MLSKDQVSERRVDLLWVTHFVDRIVRATVQNLFGPEPNSALVELICQHAEKLTPDQVTRCLERNRIHFDSALPTPESHDELSSTESMSTAQPPSVDLSASQSEGSASRSTRRSLGEQKEYLASSATSVRIGQILEVLDGLRRANPQSLSKIKEVRPRVYEAVAKRRHVNVNTIQDKYARQLELSTPSFDSLVLRWLVDGDSTLRRHLERYAVDEHRDQDLAAIQEFFARPMPGNHGS